MPREAFEHKGFKPETASVILLANEIIEEYRQYEIKLTLRQLFYQFVHRKHLPNNPRSYKRLGNIINDGRLSGLIDWSAIEDRLRKLERNNHWDSPEEIVRLVAEQYAIDKWAEQPLRMECWIEKDALVGVIETVCKDLDIDWFACRGYVSQSVQYDAGKRIARYIQGGQRVVILHLGDHDPSGVDMSRDNRTRLHMFSRFYTTKELEIRRIALNMSQIEELDLPPDPAKASDSRFENYSREHGDGSWELDALDPRYMRNLIEAEVLAERDPDIWEEAVAREQHGRTNLLALSDRWSEVVDFLNPDDEED